MGKTELIWKSIEVLLLSTYQKFKYLFTFNVWPHLGPEVVIHNENWQILQCNSNAYSQFGLKVDVKQNRKSLKKIAFPPFSAMFVG